MGVDSVPAYVLGTAGVSAMMVLTSAWITASATGGDVGTLLYLDCLATQNLGHAAFLAGFATSYWRGGNVLGRMFCVCAPTLLAVHAAAAAAAAGSSTSAGGERWPARTWCSPRPW